MEGSRFMVQVWGLGEKVKVSGFKVAGAGFRAQRTKLMCLSERLGCRASGRRRYGVQNVGL